MTLGVTVAEGVLLGISQMCPSGNISFAKGCPILYIPGRKEIKEGTHLPPGGGSPEVLDSLLCLTPDILSCPDGPCSILACPASAASLAVL